MSISIKLPLKVTAQIASIKLPIKQTVSLLIGFILSENIVSWKEQRFLVSEAVKSRILLNAEMLDKNHIKIKWMGDLVPKVEIYRKFVKDSYGEPEAYAEWADGEYIFNIDSNAYEIKVLGSDDTGESDRLIFGQHQEYDVNVYFELPINEKYYYIEADITSVYKVEVNL